MRSKTVRKSLFLLAAATLPAFTPARAAVSYDDWATGQGLTGDNAAPGANPDNDSYPNSLEYIFGGNPNVPDNTADLGPWLEFATSGAGYFFWRLSHDAKTIASSQPEQSIDDMQSWGPVAGSVQTDPETGYDLQYVLVEPTGRTFYRLNSIFGFSPVVSTVVVVGTNAGSGWEGMTPQASVVIRTTPPPVSGTDETPNDTKYPSVVGTSRTSFTPKFLEDALTAGHTQRRRSWMGWFLWGDGTPPPGLTPGYPVTGNFTGDWDFFSFQFPAKSTTPATEGAWKPVRLDQQPLYLNPFRVNYAWPPGMFGYKQRPLLPFATQTFYWAQKKIVRGPNLSYANPFFVQYANYVNAGDTPDVWRESWFYMRTRPLETTILVPSNLKPAELLANGNWNNVGTVGTPIYEVFPYPVWDLNLPPKDQTPFNILVDRMGDWDADLVWEGTNPNADGYATRRYVRTAFNQPGVGNYMKMTVAQGSPLIWCETNNNKYMIFYNLIRTNIKNQIATNTGTDAKTIAGGPWDVPGVTGVKYVLLYGDHTNPNQWFHEVAPLYWNGTSETAGGYNPSGSQHNHTYTAVYYRTDKVQPVTIAANTSNTTNNGTDAQGNPYFYLEFTGTGKNWFVVGAVPVMHYYHSNVTVDNEATRVSAARSWAEAMGGYAFNYLTNTSIAYSSTNMYLVTQTYSTSLQNPYVATGASNAANMTLTNSQTVMALQPHHYQPITLGPDLSQAGAPEIQWTPLAPGAYTDFGPPATIPPNANKSDPTSPSRWDYWSPRGTAKTVVAGSLTLELPFQNFMPMMPPPNWSKEYPQTGIQEVVVTDVGEGNHEITTQAGTPAVTIHKADGVGGQDAEFIALLEPFTGRLLQVDVVNPGYGYPEGNPPASDKVWLEIADPTTPGGVKAEARLQIGGGGKVLAVFMNNKGSGYLSTISASQANVSSDPVVIVPPWNPTDGADKGKLITGPAKIISGGAGFNFTGTNSPTVTFHGTGNVSPTLHLVKPGELVGIRESFIGGFTSPGVYPATGNLTMDKASVAVHVPPPGANMTAQTAAIQNLTYTPAVWGGTAIINRGNYTTKPDASFLDDDGQPVVCNVDFSAGSGEVINVTPTGVFKINTPKTVSFTNATATTPAEAIVYGSFKLEPFSTAVGLTGNTVMGYKNDVQVSFSGLAIHSANVTPPQFTFTLNATTGAIANVTVSNAGAGLKYPFNLKVYGGKGYDAAVTPILDSQGRIIRVVVRRQGSNYPTTVHAKIIAAAAPTQEAQLSVVVQDGKIVAVNVTNQGLGYASPPNIAFTSVPNGDPDANPAKGAFAEFICGINATTGGVNAVTLLTNGQQRYLPGTQNGDTLESPGMFVVPSSPAAWVSAVNANAKGYIGRVVRATNNVEQVVYDNIITQYTTFASNNLRPFGGGFGGGSGPDGYGLGNQLSATAKFINILYQLQQDAAAHNRDQPAVPPSEFAFDAGNIGAGSYELPIYQVHNPLITLTGALKTSVQGLQRTLTLLHTDPPYHNNPVTSDWQMDYFSQFDSAAGRLVVNPTGTIPVLGVVSSIPNPPDIPAAENDPKPPGLTKWRKGMLWSGFGVSDQWNDQHYFYGYYLSTAAIVAMLDGSWNSNITSKPASVWADAGEMGTAIDQWLLTLAYDPDNTALNNVLYTNHQFGYQKFAFFDQWNGHAWATGASPGRAGDVEDGLHGALVPWSVWNSYGTGNAPYDDENENSNWEALQAWSAIVMWGGATDRKSVVDLGMYLLATGQTTGDLYFHDKNYNLPRSSANQYSWVPVTTIASSAVGNNGGNNNIPANTGFVETTPPAFYTAYPAWGGAGSAGTSILHKGSPSLNNFFYAFPTGSKFIQSFPSQPWTLGISRNTNYMKRWAGSMMRTEWNQARNSSLFQGADWLGMALASALSGVPYNPGDVPFTESQTGAETPAVDTYVDRLWSSWVTRSTAAGSEAAKPPAYTSLDVLTFLHAFDEYGTPDWTYVGKAVSAGGAEEDKIVFTAAFTKRLNATTVRTTFVAFNPGWETRHANFYRIGFNNNIGSTPVNPSAPMIVPPKKLVVTHIDVTP